MLAIYQIIYTINQYILLQIQFPHYFKLNIGSNKKIPSSLCTQEVTLLLLYFIAFTLLQSNQTYLTISQKMKHSLEIMQYMAIQKNIISNKANKNLFIQPIFYYQFLFKKFENSLKNKYQRQLIKGLKNVYIYNNVLMKLSSKDKIINESVQQKLQKARDLKNAEKYQEAIEMYHKVIFLKQNSDALIDMAEIYQKMMDLSTAILFYKRSLQTVPRHDIKQKIQNLTLVKGMQMLGVGSVKNILHDTQFTTFIRRYPNFHRKVLSKAKTYTIQTSHFSQYFLSCLAYLQVNQRQLALDTIQNCLIIDEKNVDAIVLKGLLYWSLMENKKGYQCFWNAWRIDPNNQQVKAFLDMVVPHVEQLYKQSKYDLISKDYTKCRIKVKKALQMYPHHTRFLILSSYLYRIKQEYQQALGQLEAANKSLNKEDIALQDELRNQIALTYNQMGVYLFKHYKFEEAIKLFTEGISYKPKDWTMYCNRGDCLKGMNDYVKALEDYQRAYELQKKNQDLNFRLASIYNIRGIALFNSKNFEHAIKQFNESIKYSPKCVNFYASKAKCYMQMGLKAQALNCLTQASKIDPNHAQTKQMLSNFKQQAQKKLVANKKIITLNKQK